MGYFSDLDVRVKERGHKPGTKSYDAAAIRVMKSDCQEHRQLSSCRPCTENLTCNILRGWRDNMQKGR